MLPASAPLPAASASISLALLGDGRDALVLRGLLDREPLRGRVLAHWSAQDVPLTGEGVPVAAWALVLTAEDTTAVTPPQHLDRYDAIVLCAGIGTGTGSGSGSGSGDKPGVSHHHRTTTIASLLRNAALPHSVLQGEPASQARQCLGLAEHLARRKGWMWPQWQQPASSSTRRWLGMCEKCSDPDCEHRLFSGLVGQRGNA